ncbi:GNAT family N-acetyltransferase [Streptomyces sp. G-G2]|uniref:GNAT family N-acetyltransferase n=1 Tax=Streptomyces sp. G-G2 TaxID=3046201 RepID=UPI0024BAD21E|nr:GNAT family N-acetyltransferase [Streptomyces sp. G-G2]MDJ0385549.1 GNAT family N-acetyltransferase [Streptomyces sp. G-G2]
MEISLRLIPWSEDDAWLLTRANEPEMTKYLGGPESEERLADRQRRYIALSAQDPAAGRMFRVALATSGETVGSVGFWPREWRDQEVYESGWAVLPEHQGRGLAVAAIAELLAYVREHGTRRIVHAFPATDHSGSHSVCRRAGFESLGEVNFEYPPGVFHPSHDWRYTLPA